MGKCHESFTEMYLVTQGHQVQYLGQAVYEISYTLVEKSMIDWFIHFNGILHPSTIILCFKVRELHSMYIFIFFVQFFLKRIFFAHGSTEFE